MRRLWGCRCGEFRASETFSSSEALELSVPPVQNRTICFVLSGVVAAVWRFASAVARLRADPITALAPLSHMLISGFFFSQGFLMRSQLKGNSRAAVTPA